MRDSVSNLENRRFDVAVIGGGINGSAAAREAAGAGYSVILIEKGDYGSGATSRSSRLVHCGLRYLAPGGPMSMFMRHPRMLVRHVRTVRRSMRARNDLVKRYPQRMRKVAMHLPIYRDGPYAGWQLDAAFGLLGSFGERSVPLAYHRLGHRRALETLPFAASLRSPERIDSVSTYTEYQLDWPERLAVDAALSVEAHGGKSLNYTKVVGFRDAGDCWRLTLGDEDGALATISAKALLNFAGPWIDETNQQAGQSARRVVNGTKGAHIMVKLPKPYAGAGLMLLTDTGHPFYCFPWREMHFFGPTETPYEGLLDDVRADADDVEHLLATANRELPGLRLHHKDVLYTWAGVRPLTHDPASGAGVRGRTFHSLGRKGGPLHMALTNGSIGAHLTTAADAVKQLAARIKPSVPTETVLATSNAIAPESARCSGLEAEHVKHLVDVLWGRMGTVWDADQGLGSLDKTIRALASELDWDDERIKSEVHQYENLIRCILPPDPGRAGVKAARQKNCWLRGGAFRL